MWRIFLMLIAALIVKNAWAATDATPMCKTDETCVSEQVCWANDDAGRGKIGPRIDSVCGPKLVCCKNSVIASVLKVTLEEDDPNTMPLTTMPSVYESCGLNMECVERHLCNGTINDSGRYIISSVGVRIDGADICKPLQKCCKVDDKLPTNPHLNSTFMYKGCGYSNPDGLYYNLVGYNDSEASFGEFPWMVAIMSGRSRYECGGTLIHGSVVLTAAHCVSNHTTDTLVVRAGEWDSSSQQETLPHQNRRIKILRVHEQFDEFALFNDIAILVLQEPFDIRPHVQPICLPQGADPKVFKHLRQASCFATGWGRKNYNNATLVQSILKRIDLPVVQHDECEESLRQTILGRRFWLRPSFLCAGGEHGKDTCKGDGGSPLFCTMAGEQDRYELAGLVSWGIGCGEDGIPGVYANIPYMRDWIVNTLAALGITIS